MGKKILNLGIGLALLGLVGVAIYYRAFYEREPGQLSEAGQMSVDLAQVIEELEAERSSEQGSQVADEEAESVQGSALESPEERRALWEAVRSAIEEARQARVPASEASDLAQPDQSGEPHRTTAAWMLPTFETRWRR